MTSGHNNRKGRNKGHRHSGQRPRGSQPANAPTVQPKPAAPPIAPPAMPPSPTATAPTFGPPEDDATPPSAVSMPRQVAHPEQAPGVTEQATQTAETAPLAQDTTPALPPLAQEPHLQPERFQARDPHPQSRQDLRQEPRMRHPLPAPAPSPAPTPARPQPPRDTAPRPPLARPRTGEAGQPYLPRGANGHQNGYHNGHTHDRATEPPMAVEPPHRSDRFVLANRAGANDWREDERDERDEQYEGGERPARQLDVRGEVGSLIDSLHALFADNRATASQGGVARCGICYLYFRVGDLTYREQEGFYVCASCASALGATRLPMVRRQQR